MPAPTDPVAARRPSPGVAPPSRVVFGPHETNLGTGRAIGHAPRRLLPGAGRRRCRRHRHRDGVGAPVGLALRAGPAGLGLRPGLAGGGRCLPPPRHRWCWPGSATPAARGRVPTRRPSLWAPSPVADAASREMPMEMGRAEIDAAGRRVRRRRPSRRRGRPRRGGDRRRGVVAAAPVPLGAHQPARRRLRRGPAADSPARCSTPSATPSGRTTWSASASRATSWPRGPGSPRNRPPTRSTHWPTGSTCSPSCGAGPTPPPPTAPTPTPRPGSTSSCARPCDGRPAGGSPSCCRAAWSTRTMADRRPRPTGPADLVEMTRAQIAEPDLVALVARRDGPAGPAPASCATRPAGSATTATR